ncbi:hypothetical protein QNH14_09285 [Apirhabdus apintestini]|uniref:hypothetical protein n=1 Tax=Erwinia sp. HR93 TaxID=3094840 RepID=UPI002ADEB191|nr:hypothetical protein [Erwinia sp. HR93]MEA1064972.1 hypothetical protein [Erwinia sp. HR93]WPM85802.1 hypothetical protein QNH14_09285 [Enterobacteriaceae bacterium CA-0114]
MPLIYSVVAIGASVLFMLSFLCAIYLYLKEKEGQFTCLLVALLMAFIAFYSASGYVKSVLQQQGIDALSY